MSRRRSSRHRPRWRFHDRFPGARLADLPPFPGRAALRRATVAIGQLEGAVWARSPQTRPGSPIGPAGQTRTRPRTRSGCSDARTDNRAGGHDEARPAPRQAPPRRPSRLDLRRSRRSLYERVERPTDDGRSPMGFPCRRRLPSRKDRDDSAPLRMRESAPDVRERCQAGRIAGSSLSALVRDAATRLARRSRSRSG